MKTKKLERKLALSKETITNLDAEEMRIAQGGTREPSVPSVCRWTGCSYCC
ncbi:MAG: hypothetical protein GY940_06980 [bacterium]|nr:hypothetical protein [bacterium]